MSNGSQGGHEPHPPGPLSGVRVLDLTAVVLGPLATQILGDYGADIIKVESLTGDMMRANGVSQNKGMSSIFLALNRNKRSLGVNLQTPEGASLLARLIPSADVLVHNMRPEAMARLGFSYDGVRTLNPAIIYCVATGFDQDGPDHAKPAFDDIIQAASGLAAMVSIGRDHPAYVPTLVADKTAGMALANAVLAALFHRQRSGEGQFIEVPMFETFAAFMLAEHLGGMSFQPPAGPAGYARLLEGGRAPSPTKDGHIAMLPYTAAHWLAFAHAIGREDLVASLELDDPNKRNANIQMLYKVVAEETPKRTSAEWMALCERLDIPASPLRAIDELPAHPQLAASGLFQTMAHPTEGTLRYVRPTTKFSRSPASVRTPAPRIGEHSRELLREVGVTDVEIDALIRRGIIIQPQATE